MNTVYQDYKTEVVQVNEKLELLNVTLKRWVCRGPYGVTYHKTEQAALKEAESREAFDKKFPYKVPKGKRTGK